VGLALGAGALLAAGACKGGYRGRDTATAGGAVSDSAARDTANRANTAAGASGLSDANIVAMLDAANAADSASGALAVRKGRNADVKAFGRLMMGEHHALRVQGQQLARKLGVTPQAPADWDLPKQHDDQVKDLEGKSGADFDKTYIDDEVDVHQKVMDLTNRALASAQNPELKDLIQKAQPVIQKHLDRAKQIQGRIKT
jgi:putative membrane protein